MAAQEGFKIKESNNRKKGIVDVTSSGCLFESGMM